MISPQELRDRIDRLPRVSLAHLPTPLEELPRLSAALGGPRIFIKRDDCTGLAFGGNKARHNEFILGRALEEGADTLVWGAGIQSNNCRQTAAAAAKLGLECHLVLTTDHAEMEFQGNFLLDHLVGARIELNSEPMGPPLWNKIKEKSDSLRDEGKRVFTIADPPSRFAASVSYTGAFMELRDQLDEQNVRADAVYFSSSGSTGAGMFLGRKLLQWEAVLEAIMPIEWPFDTAEYMAKLANGAAELMGLEPAVTLEDIQASPDYIGAGYGIPTPEGLEAISLLARQEGILLDPIYTGKAMGALVADVRRGRWRKGQNLVFVHTGGTPALFYHHRDLAPMFDTAGKEG